MSLESNSLYLPSVPKRTALPSPPERSPSTYPWQTAYVFAISETDEVKVRGRLSETITAVEQRRLIPRNSDEEFALTDAEAGLAVAIRPSRGPRPVGVKHFDGNKERWKALCEKAEVEKDLAKLQELVNEINHLLDEKEARLKASSPKEIK